jgi:hypothetical protein
MFSPMGRSMVHLLKASLAILVALACQGAFAARLNDTSQRLLLTALVDDQWALYHSDNLADWFAINVEGEPRTPTISNNGNRVAFVTADGSLRELELSSLEVKSITDGSTLSLTHPSYDDAGNLLVVRLIDGASVNTEIGVIKGGGYRPIHQQRSAHFEPVFTPTPEPRIYFSHVSCTVACGGVIQEIWMRDLVSGVARQVTLLNSTSRQPFVGPSGDVYFSSNAQGTYDIWTVSSGGTSEAVTAGPEFDSQPVVRLNGDLLFIRHSVDGASLMRRAAGSIAPERVSLPFDFSDLKDLKVSQ